MWGVSWVRWLSVMGNKLLIIVVLLFVSCSQPKLDSNYVEIDFKNLSIAEFVAYVSKVTGKEIRIEEEIKGKISFTSHEPLLKSELMPLVNAILENKRMTLVNMGEFYRVVKSNAIGCTYDDIFKPGRRETRAFKLYDLNMTVVRTKIKPLLPKNAKVLEFRAKNVLSITAYTGTLHSIGKLIGKMRERESVDLATSSIPSF